MTQDTTITLKNPQTFSGNYRRLSEEFGSNKTIYYQTVKILMNPSLL
ncbi:hypothetical protein ADIS_1387 [Lunatimonas lonarensis]|uniref:Uncharacterized protein n=1 Tax=Lunatimonas lonarensis TaxID=1232681 RepID=R7ZVM3_9BACT|nr:hypothetical protein ADIS_1387 [Lunatimonas lonarensis]